MRIRFDSRRALLQRHAAAAARLHELGAALGVVLVVLVAGTALAEDERPRELPYLTPDAIPLLGPDYRQGENADILVTDDEIRPRLARIREGELVAWRSISKASTTIVFEREVARSMVCHHLVNFFIQDDEIRSAPLHAGELASFCELKPGHYRYRIVRTNPEHAGAGGAARRLDGWIQVLEKEDLSGATAALTPTSPER